MPIVDINLAVAKLKAGELVVIPTETVYGLAADGLNAQAVENIFVAKGRPLGNPLILHICSREMLNALVKVVPIKAEKLIKEFWPGPLTLVFDKSALIPEIVTAGLKSVCVRMPAHPMALEVIERLGRPVAAPSSNKSGRPSPTNVKDAQKEMPEIAIVDGGDCQHGLESTVVDARGDKVMILRLGSLTVSEIERVLEEKVEIVGGKKDQAISPGMKYKHYSPTGEVILIWPWESFGEKYSKLNKSKYWSVEEACADNYSTYKCGIVCVNSRVNLYNGYEILALGESAEEQAANLYKILHQSEALAWQKIIVDMTGIDIQNNLKNIISDKNDSLRLAILERLKRSAE